MGEEHGGGGNKKVRKNPCRIRARKFMSRDVSTETLNFNVPVSRERPRSRSRGLGSPRARFKNLEGRGGGLYDPECAVPRQPRGWTKGKKEEREKDGGGGGGL